MDAVMAVLGLDEIGRIQPLWSRLNAIHLADSVHFKEHYRNFTFEARFRNFMGMPPENIRVLVLKEEEEGEALLGYCICTVKGSMGEIDSMYVEAAYRKRGYGKRLVETGLAWLREKGCGTIVVAVAEGHEEVFGFYGKMGFYPRLTCLQLKDGEKRAGG